MPPVIYPPLDNPDRAFIHLVSSHGHAVADAADAVASVDLAILRIEHYGDHARHPCDHIHAWTDQRRPTRVRRLPEGARP